MISKECGLGAFLFLYQGTGREVAGYGRVDEDVAYKQTGVNRNFGVLRKMFNLAEV
ncbi:hypothetical protein [Pectobacterium aroidearum]|uniref:hypothetical protein n=1 Tax=Pectobacterium aroidearum TaxID=1201031 RepID=UPI003DA0242B